MVKDIESEIDGHSLTKHSKTFTEPQPSQNNRNVSKSWFARVLILILSLTGLIIYTYLQTRNGLLESKLDQINSDISDLTQKINNIKSGLDRYMSSNSNNSETSNYTITKQNSTRLSKFSVSSESTSASYVLVTGKASK